MSTTPFEIKVVYDASRRKRGGAVVRTARAGRVGTANTWMIVGAVLNFAVAGGMYYATWWKIDPFIYITLLKKTPFPVTREFAANPLGLRSLTAPAEALEPIAAEEIDSEPASPWRWSAKFARISIGGTAYFWLTLATIGACAVAMAGGAWLGLAEGRWARVLGAVGGVALLVGIAYMGYRVWTEYKAMFEPNQLRIGIGLLTLLAALLGLAVATRARGITKMAGGIVLVAAVVTAAGMWLWTQNGALETKYAGWGVLAAAFAIHAVWGAVLLVSVKRIRA